MIVGVKQHRSSRTNHDPWEPATREHSGEEARTVPRINETDGEEESGAQCIMGRHAA